MLWIDGSVSLTSRVSIRRLILDHVVVGEVLAHVRRIDEAFAAEGPNGISWSDPRTPEKRRVLHDARDSTTSPAPMRVPSTSSTPTARSPSIRTRRTCASP